MTLAPIVIFCYNRPKHLTKTLNDLFIELLNLCKDNKHNINLVVQSQQLEEKINETDNAYEKYKYNFKF